MGEYYDWVNVDRKEYISPVDFNLGSKRHESMGRKNTVLRALRELLSKEWAGNHVFFMGDEKKVPSGSNNETLKKLYNHTVLAGYPELAYETVIETYRNISGLFKATENEVRREINYYIEDLKSDKTIAHNDYGVDVSNPFEGLFLRTGKDFRYTINHTKRIYYSFTQTKIRQLDHTEDDFVDPLPLLMAYGRQSDTGAWVGDIIGVGDEIPEGYELLKDIFLDW